MKFSAWIVPCDRKFGAFDEQSNGKTVEVEAENASTAQFKLSANHPGYSIFNVTWQPETCEECGELSPRCTCPYY